MSGLFLLLLGTSASNGNCLYFGAAVAVNAVPSFSLGKEGSVIGICLYLGPLNRGCKGWEGSRDDLYYGLTGKRGKVQGFCHLDTKLVSPLLTPPPEGVEVLSRTERRGRWLRPRSLRAPWGRLEPLARRVRALMWFREFLLGLRSSAQDLKYHWRPVLTQDVGGWGSFWRLESHFNDWVRQGSAWRGLRVVLLRVAAALWEWDRFSWRVSHKFIFVCCPIGRPREVVSDAAA